MPSLLTLLNLAAGAVAILLCTEGNYFGAAIAVLAALPLDALDGWTARKLSASSDFGGRLDSLADIISFGMAPAVILYGIGLKELGNAGLVVAILLPVAAGVRLARFQSVSATGNFSGLPITPAGGMVAALVVSRVVLPASVWAVVVMLLAILMVSRVSYPHINRLDVRDTMILRKLLFVGLVIGVIVAFTFVNLKHMVIIPLMIYILYGINYWILHKARIVKG